MNLVVDIGNSSTKIAIYKGKEQVSSARLSESDCARLEKKLSGYKVKKAIISSVKTLPPFISDIMFSNIKFVHVLSHRSELPFSIEYETPETLGTDRIAAVAGAYSLYPEAEILVIDTGSAITYDFLQEGIYKGGNISPGLTMRSKALKQFTGKLPLVTLPDKYTSPGRNTVEAIAAGIITGVIYEINEYIRTFQKRHSDSKIILSGGDSGYLKEKIDHKCIYMPDIVLDGLNYILEYNAK